MIMSRRNGYLGPRGSFAKEAEFPTWPHDTEYMLRLALYLKKNRRVG